MSETLNSDKFNALRQVDFQSVEGLPGLKGLGTNPTKSRSDVQQRINQSFGEGAISIGDIYNQPGVDYSTYDKESKNLFDFESQTGLAAHRADAQSWTLKATNAVIGGLSGSIFTALEDMSGMVAYFQELGYIGDTDRREGNAVMRWSKQVKEDIYEAMPIYEMPGNGALDQFFKWSSLRGMLDSVVGFGAPGLLIGKGMSMLGKGISMMRPLRTAAYLDTVLDTTTAFAKASEAARAGYKVSQVNQAIQSIAGGFLMNIGEAAVMNMELGEQAEQEEISARAREILASKYGNNDLYGGLALEDATKAVKEDVNFQRLIGEQQKSFALANKLMIGSDIFSLHGLFKLKGITRNAVTKQSFKQVLKNLTKISPDNLILQGLKESGEEMYQNAMQDRNAYNIRKGAGHLTEEDEKLRQGAFARTFNFAFTDQAIVEGLMGFFSGGLQRGMMGAIAAPFSNDAFGSKARKASNDLYDKQQEFQAKLQKRAMDVFEHGALSQTLDEMGHEAMSKLVDGSLEQKLIFDAIQLGTVDKLERTLMDITSKSKEQLAKDNYHENSAELAGQTLENLRAAEYVFLENKRRYGDAAFELTKLMYASKNLHTLKAEATAEMASTTQTILDKYNNQGLTKELLTEILSGKEKLSSPLLTTTMIELINDPIFKKLQDFEGILKQADGQLQKLSTLSDKVKSKGFDYRKYTNDKRQKEVLKIVNSVADYVHQNNLVLDVYELEGEVEKLDDDGQKVIEFQAKIIKEGEEYFLMKYDADTNSVEDIPDNENKSNRTKLTPENISRYITRSNAFQQLNAQNADASTTEGSKSILKKLSKDYADRLEAIKNTTLTKEEETQAKEALLIAHNKALNTLQVAHNKVIKNKKLSEAKKAEAEEKFNNDKAALEAKLTKDTEAILGQALEVKTRKLLEEFKQATKDAMAEFSSEVSDPILSLISETTFEEEFGNTKLDDEEFTPLRSLYNWFFGSKGNLMPLMDDKTYSTDPVVRRWFHFLENYSPLKYSGKLVRFTEAEIKAMPGDEGKGFKKINPDTGTYYAQYKLAIVNSKGEYLNLDNEFKITYSKTFNPNTAVFSTMAFSEYTFEEALSLTGPIRDEYSQEEYEYMQKEYRKFLTKHSKGKEFKLAGKSKGVKLRGTNTIEAPINTVVKSIDDVEIIVSTATETYIPSINKTVGMKRGEAIVVDPETADTHQITPKTDSQALQAIRLGIVELFSQFITNSITSDGKFFVKSYLGLPAKNFNEYLRALTSWSGNNMHKDGTPIFTNPAFQFHFVSNDDLPGKFSHQIVIGGVTYSMVIENEDGTLDVNVQMLNALMGFLSQSTTNIFQPLLTDNKPFITYSSINGKIEQKTYKSYKHFLLEEAFDVFSDENSGTTETINGVEYAKPTRVNKYVVIEPSNLAVPPAKKVAPENQQPNKAVEQPQQSSKELTSAPTPSKTTVNLQQPATTSEETTLDKGVELIINTKPTTTNPLQVTSNAHNFEEISGTQSSALGKFSFDGKIVQLGVASLHTNDGSELEHKEALQILNEGLVGNIDTPNATLKSTPSVFSDALRAFKNGKETVTISFSQVFFEDKNGIKQAYTFPTAITVILNNTDTLATALDKITLAYINLYKTYGKALTDTYNTVLNTAAPATISTKVTPNNEVITSPLSQNGQPIIKGQRVILKSGEIVRIEDITDKVIKFLVEREGSRGEIAISFSETIRILSKPDGPSQQGNRSRRKVIYKDLPPAKKEALDESIKWFKQKFPNISFELVENLIMQGYYGEFVDSLVRLDKNAPKGVLYHEAFHVVFNLYMPTNEKSSLIQAIKNSTFFANYVEAAKKANPQLNHADQLEEALADIFMDMMDGVIDEDLAKTDSMWQTIKNFFKDIAAYIGFAKQVYNEADYNRKIVKQLLSIKNHVSYSTPISIKNKKTNSKFKTIPQLTNEQTQQFLKGIHSYVVMNLRKTPKGIYTLYNTEATDSELIQEAIVWARSQIEAMADATSDTLRGYMDLIDNAATLEDAELQALNNAVDNIDLETHALNTLSLVLYSWNDTSGAYELYQNYLREFKINLQDDTSIDENREELEKSKDNAQYASSNNLINHRANMNKAIKLLTSSLIDLKPDGTYYRTFFGFPALVPSGQVYKILISKLSNLTFDATYEEMIEQLELAAEYQPAIRQLYEEHPAFEQFYSTITEGDHLMTPPLLRFDKMNPLNADNPLTISEAFALAQFVQTFTKYKYTYFATMISAPTGKAYAYNRGHSLLVNSLKTIWQSKRRALIKDPKYKPYFKLDSFGNVMYEREAFSSLPVVLTPTVEDIHFRLNILGYPVSDIIAKVIADSPALAAHISQALSQVAIGNSIVWDSRIIDNLLAPLEAKYGTIIELSHKNLNDDIVYDHGLHSFVTVTVTKLNNILNGNRELKEALPHLDPEHNPNTRNSVILGWANDAKQSDRQISFGENEGLQEIDLDIKTPFRNAHTSDKLKMQYQLSYKGIYSMLRTADSSQNRVLSVSRPFLSHDDIFKNNDWAGETFKIFRNYLVNELSKFVALEDDFTHFKTNSKDVDNYLFGWLLDGLTLESPIALSPAEFGEWFVSANEAAIKENFINFILAEVKERKKALFDQEIIKSAGHFILDYGFSERRYEDDYSKITDEILQEELLFHVLNNNIAIAEQMNLFFGDIAYYKSFNNSFKRFKAAVGTKENAIVSEWMNTLVNNKLKKINNNPHLYDANGNPILRTRIYEDVIVVSTLALNQLHLLDKENPQYINTLAQIAKENELTATTTEEIYNQIKDNPELVQKTLEAIIELKNDGERFIANPYLEMEEGDGASMSTIDGYRTLRFRVGEWTTNLEKRYQWEVQIREGVPVKDRVFTDLDTGKTRQLLEKEIKGVVFNVLKPQYLGPLADADNAISGFIPTMYKTGLMPLLPSVYTEMNLPAMKALEERLINDNVDIAAFQSANKGVATKTVDGKVNRLYNETGQFVADTEEAFNQDTYFEYWGLQLNTGTTQQNSVTTATQAQKQILNGIFDQGQIAEKYSDKDNVKGLVDNYLAANNARLELGKAILLKKLGASKLNNVYTIQDLSSLADTINHIALEKGSPDSVFESVDLLVNELAVLDTLPAKSEIENILLSLSNKQAITLKRSGKAAYQVPSTLFNANRDRQVSFSERKTSSDLKASYQTLANGKLIITNMEVYLPYSFKGKIDINDPNLMKNLIAFRIPTQYVSSIEVVTVKGFLPESAGDTIVLPSEIVAKSGSDFDIDKMYVYIPNTLTVNGKITYLNPNISNQLFQDNIDTLVINRLLSVVPDLPGAYKEFIKHYYKNSTTKTVAGVKNALINYITAQEKLKVIDDKVMNSLANLDTLELEFYLKATENLVTELQAKLWSIGERASEALAPIQTNVLEAVADEINAITNKEFTYDNILPSRMMFNNNYNQYLEKAYIEGSIGIGPSALIGAFHISAQLGDFKLKGGLFFPANKLSEERQDEKGNPTTVNLIGLGGLRTYNGKYLIADLINQMISGGTDIVNKTWATDLGINASTLNIFLAGTLMGMDPYTLGYIINQPIIKDYLDRKVARKSGIFYKSIGHERSTRSNKDLIDLLKRKNYAGSNTRLVSTLSPDALDAALKSDLAATSPKYQHSILDAFLLLEKYSQRLSQAIINTNFDTKGTAIDAATLKIRLNNSFSNIFSSNIEGLNESLLTGFLSPYLANLVDIDVMLSPFYLATSDKGLNFNNLLTVLATSIANTKRLTAEQKSTLFRQIMEDYTTYAIMTTPIVEKGNKTLAQLSEEFMVGENSVPRAILEAKEMFPDNLLLQGLHAVLNENGKDFLVFTEKSMETSDKNIIMQESWPELYDIPYGNEGGTLGEYLMYQAFAQNGVSSGISGFAKLINPAAYHAFVSKAIDPILNGTRIVDNQEFYNTFFLNRNYMRNVLNAVTGFGPISTRLKVLPQYAKKTKEGLKKLRINGYYPYEKYPMMAIQTSPMDSNLKYLVEGDVATSFGGTNQKFMESFMVYGSEQASRFLKALANVNSFPHEFLGNNVAQSLLLFINQLTNDLSKNVTNVAMANRASNRFIANPELQVAKEIIEQNQSESVQLTGELLNTEDTIKGDIVVDTSDKMILHPDLQEDFGNTKTSLVELIDLGHVTKIALPATIKPLQRGSYHSQYYTDINGNQFEVVIKIIDRIKKPTLGMAKSFGFARESFQTLSVEDNLFYAIEVVHPLTEALNTTDTSATEAASINNVTETVNTEQNSSNTIDNESNTNQQKESNIDEASMTKSESLWNSHKENLLSKYPTLTLEEFQAKVEALSNEELIAFEERLKMCQ